MDLPVAAAVLAAALLHASWHALIKSSGDGVVALAGMNLVSGTLALLLLPFVRLPNSTAATIIALSLLLHCGYKIALAQLYARSDLSVGYPLARGVTPVCATLLAFVFLGEVPSAAVAAGIIAISLGIIGLVTLPGSLASVAVAIAVGVFVAAYSALDAYGVRINGDWIGFTAWLVAADSVLFAAYALAMRRGTALAQWRQAWVRTLVRRSAR